MKEAALCSLYNKRLVEIRTFFSIISDPEQRDRQSWVVCLVSQLPGLTQNSGCSPTDCRLPGSIPFHLRLLSTCIRALKEGLELDSALFSCFEMPVTDFEISHMIGKCSKTKWYPHHVSFVCGVCLCFSSKNPISDSNSSRCVFIFQDYNDEIRQEQLRELSYLNGSEESGRGRGIRGRGIRITPTAPSRYASSHSERINSR